MRTLYEPSWQTEWLSLSSDGRRAAVTEGYASDHGLLSGSVMVIDLVDGTTTDPWPDLQTVGIAEWIDDDSLWYARGDGTGTACGRMWLDGRREERWRGDAFIGDEVTTPACRTSDGASTVWTTHQAHGQPPELARLDQAGAEWSRFTSFNDAIVDGVVFPDARTIRWSAPDGMEIEGILMTPRSVDGPLPLIACVHGGPTWNWGAFFSDSEPNAVLLASAGYACLLPNPRGSIGRGHAFAQAVIGDSGGVDFQDIMSGIDRCIADGVADPARLGIAGLSYGGFMAGWAVGQTARFGASVAMSVVANNVSFHLTSEVWMYDEMILKGDWNDPASQYLERSPVTHAHRCTTPTLILQGAEDRCTPVGQGEELYAAITAAGAETELVVYPREGHVPLERAHALDAIRRTQAWFDRFLRERDNDVAGGSAATPTSGTTSSPARNPTEIVSLGYDVVAEDYANLEGIVEWPRMRWLRKVLAELRPESRVLDLGCGSGIPATREIARVHDVVGVDVSARRIELARRNVPGAEFIHDDIESLHFPQASFDAVVAFYVLDHLPRESHADVLGRIHGWLKPGGLLLLTVETEDEPGVTSLWLGVDMFFSCFDAGTTRRLIREAGFETLDDAVETQIEGEREVTYLWVLARSTFSGHPSTGSARRVVNDENHLKQRTTRNDRPGS
jgi:SAM-dependent methyltransferase/dienelactone hydrolase